MSDGNFRQAVLAAWGDECLVRVRFPEAWLNTTSGTRYQDTLSLHHINGDDTDDRVANVIPLYQSCYIHIHKVDEHPYRQGHRQLPIEHRNAWNPHYKEYYEGPRLNSKQAGWFFGDDDAESQRESGVGEHRFEQVGCSLWVLLGGQLTHLRKGVVAMEELNRIRNWAMFHATAWTLTTCPSSSSLSLTRLEMAAGTSMIAAMTTHETTARTSE